MESSKFESIVNEQCAQIKTVLTSKAKEYSRGDRLSNFKRAAAMLGITPEKALMGMKAKHDVSIMDMVDDLDIVGLLHPMGVWDEKIGDAINYLILLKALVMERSMPHTAGVEGGWSVPCPPLGGKIGPYDSLHDDK